MSNYRIYIEQTKPGVELPEELQNGICVDGFSLIFEDEDHDPVVAIQHMKTLDVACAIAGCPSLRAAAKIAEGLREAAEIERKGNIESFIDKLRKIAVQKDD